MVFRNIVTHFTFKRKRNKQNNNEQKTNVYVTCGNATNVKRLPLWWPLPPMLGNQGSNRGSERGLNVFWCFLLHQMVRGGHRNECIFIEKMVKPLGWRAPQSSTPYTPYIHSCKLTVRWLENPPNFDGMKTRKDGIFMGELLVPGRVTLSPRNPWVPVENCLHLKAFLTSMIMGGSVISKKKHILTCFSISSA